MLLHGEAKTRTTNAKTMRENDPACLQLDSTNMNFKTRSPGKPEHKLCNLRSTQMYIFEVRGDSKRDLQLPAFVKGLCPGNVNNA